MAAYLARDDVRDCLVHPDGIPIGDLPAGTRIGTSAVRRVAQFALHWPHLSPVAIRGNANSRLAKLDAREDYDALLLAVSGLHRIGAADRITHPIDLDTFVPAVGSGTLVLQCRESDTATRDLATSLGDAQTWQETVAERTLLHILQGNCHSPIAGYARTEPDGRISLRARVISLDGKIVLDVHEWATDPVTLGTSVAAALLRQGARDILRSPSHPGLTGAGLSRQPSRSADCRHGPASSRHPSAHTSTGPRIRNSRTRIPSMLSGYRSRTTM
jgi:hydroxymethylbilane synthase